MERSFKETGPTQMERFCWGTGSTQMERFCWGTGSTRMERFCGLSEDCRLCKYLRVLYLNTTRYKLIVKIYFLCHYRKPSLFQMYYYVQTWSLLFPNSLYFHLAIIRIELIVLLRYIDNIHSAIWFTSHNILWGFLTTIKSLSPISKMR